MTLKVEWIDGGREPTQEPNPMFPDGVDLDIARERKGCETALPYPAKRIGYYYVECDVCGTTALATTAGRSDDPRSIRLPCKTKGLISGSSK
jgi:hypothetical protein